MDFPGSFFKSQEFV